MICRGQGLVAGNGQQQVFQRILNEPDRCLLIPCPGSGDAEIQFIFIPHFPAAL